MRYKLCHSDAVRVSLKYLQAGTIPHHSVAAAFKQHAAVWFGVVGEWMVSCCLLGVFWLLLW